MDREEILRILYVAARCEYDDGGDMFGDISKSASESCTLMEYQKVHYPLMVRMLESLPWKLYADECPEKDGDYLVMLDCNEHQVMTCPYKDGQWLMFHSHVKWWMEKP